MRKNIVAGNWKMNTTLPEGVALAKAVNDALKGVDAKCDVIIAMQQLDYDGPMLMLWLTCGLLAALFLLYAADRGARYLKRQSPDVKSRKNE